MKTLRVRNVTTGAVLIALFAVASWTQERKQARAQRNVNSTRPRLALLIVVDQFRYDYLTRFGDLFGSRGIGRLLRDGASWTDANFDYVPTFTAPGHATFMTGAPPALTGIIANDWYEQETGKKVKSVTDYDTLAIAGKGRSPRRKVSCFPTIVAEPRRRR